MTTAPTPKPTPADGLKATPEQVARLAALLRPHVPAMLAARAARKAAS